MEEYGGKKVPTEPKIDWGFWMCDQGAGCCVDKGSNCYGVSCLDCIYCRHNAVERKAYFEHMFCDKVCGYTSYFKGLELPVEPQKSWKWMLTEKVCGRKKECELGSHHCADCIYSMRNWERRKECYEYFFPKETPKKTVIARDHKGRFLKKTLPKLTQEVFDDPECPDWAQWAAVDKDGEASYFEQKPVLLNEVWRWPEKDVRSLRSDASNRWQYVRGYVWGKCFDASDWEHSLIQRPAKELPGLTQTAFHCPDCPKEATKLKVFPANHVVALDKDDKVLGVMDLQCKEGEVNKPKAEWYYNKEADILYYGKDFEYTNPPVGADPVRVSYLPSDVLKGTAVHEAGVAEDFLIVDVNGSLVTLVGVRGKYRIPLATLILDFRITCSGGRCCVIEPLQ